MPTIIEVLLWILGIGVVGFVAFVGLTWYGIRRFSRSKRVRARVEQIREDEPGQGSDPGEHHGDLRRVRLARMRRCRVCARSAVECSLGLSPRDLCARRSRDDLREVYPDHALRRMQGEWTAGHRSTRGTGPATNE